MGISNAGRYAMAKDKKHDKHLPPVKVGDKYICPHCEAELPVKQSCPECRQEIDWTKI
jgi:primosomal protein N'